MAKTGDPAHYAPAISVKVQKITSRKADWFELAILTVAGTHISNKCFINSPADKKAKIYC